MKKIETLILMSVFFHLVFVVGASAEVSLSDLYEINQNKSVYIKVYDPSGVNPSKNVASGTGIMLPSGYVLTSLHILGDASETDFESKLPGLVIKGMIGFSDGVPEVKLSYVTSQSDQDLVLLRFDPQISRDWGYVCTHIRTAKVGEPVAFLGFALDGPLQVGAGIVTGLEANDFLTNTIAAPGDSGSGVFDGDGKLIGVLRGQLVHNGNPTGSYVVVPIGRAAELMKMVEPEDNDACSVPPQQITGQANTGSNGNGQNVTYGDQSPIINGNSGKVVIDGN